MAQWDRVTTVAGASITVVVVLLGLALVVGPNYQALERAAAQQNCRPLEAPCKVTVTTTQSPAGGVQVQTTVEPLPLQDRLLAGGGAVVLELLLVLVGAFVGGAITQRTLRGHFALTLGPLNLPELAETATRAIRALEDRTEQLDADLSTVRTSTLDNAQAVEKLTELIELQGKTLTALAEWAQRAEDALAAKGIRIPG